MHYYITTYMGNNNLRSLILPTVGFVRILHAVPDAPNIDAYSYARSLTKNLPYSQYQDYFPLVAEPHGIALYAAGTTNSPLLAETVNITKNDLLTLSAVGMLNNIELLEIHSPNVFPDRSQAMIRFAHLSPNAPAVDITLPDGTILFGNISFKQVTPAIPILPTANTLEVRLAGTPTVVLTIPNIKLEPNKTYTLYALGLVGANPELEALVVEEPPIQDLIQLEGQCVISTE